MAYHSRKGIGILPELPLTRVPGGHRARQSRRTRTGSVLGRAGPAAPERAFAALGAHGRRGACRASALAALDRRDPGIDV
jgi:hypothetical protein